VEKCCRTRKATDDNMAHAHCIALHCIPESTYTHSEYVIVNDFSPQQWLHERACMLCCAHIICLIVNQRTVSVTYVD